MRSFLLVVLLLVVSQTTAQLDISYSGNVSSGLDVTGNGWSYRAGVLYNVDILNAYESTQYLAISAQAQQGSATIDVMAGGLVIADGNFPFVFSVSYEGSASWTVGTDFLTANAGASLGFIASSYLFLIEKDSNNNIVANHSLVQIPILGPWTHSGAVTDQGGLHYTTFSATPGLQNTWTISLTFIASDVIGKINYGGAVVTPTSLETIVAIKGYPYATSTNTLTLVMAVATGSASATESGTASGVQSGSGNGQVYFSCSKTFLNGGAVAPASVSAFTSGDYSQYAQGQNWAGQVSGKYQGQANVQLVSVQFAAGSTDIVYDPTVGTGANVQTTAGGNAASSLVASSLLLIFTALVTMLF